MAGKTFQIFLKDGEISGRMKCTLSNWDGIVYKIPREYVEKSKPGNENGINEFNHTGIYFLLGENELNQQEIYVGQAGNRNNGDGLFRRIKEHYNDDFKWKEVIIITDTKNAFGPTEISFLENKFTNKAKKSGLYKVINKNTPSIGNTTEEKEAQLEEFIKLTEDSLTLLGYKFLNKNKKKNKNSIIVKEKEGEYTNKELNKNESKSNSFELKYGKFKSKETGEYLEARCEIINGKYIVKKGSYIQLKDGKSLLTDKRKLKILRDEYKEKKYIKNGILQKDVQLDSPSSAGVFVTGRSTNGNEFWKSKEEILKSSHPVKSAFQDDKVITLYFERKIQKANRTIKAVCKYEEINGKGIYTVKAGSDINEEKSESFKNQKKSRKEYEEKGYIKNGKLLKDISFNSPSGAGSFVYGGEVDGNTYWKTNYGETVAYLKSIGKIK